MNDLERYKNEAMKQIDDGDWYFLSKYGMTRAAIRRVIENHQAAAIHLLDNIEEDVERSGNSDEIKILLGIHTYHGLFYYAPSHAYLFGEVISRGLDTTDSADRMACASCGLNPDTFGHDLTERNADDEQAG